MISLAAITGDEFPDRGSQRLFAVQDHTVQTPLSNTPDEPFGMAVQFLRTSH